jgi:RimJ/RimL family protein N-acetyltransferase
MTALIFDHSEALAAWAAARIPHVGAAGLGPCTAIGVASGDDADDELYAVAVFHDWQKAAKTLQVSMAARSPRWATQGTIRALLHYVFEQAGANKLWVAIPDNNSRAIRFNLGIGMVREAVLRHHCGWNRHAVILSMIEPEYRASRWASPRPPARLAA